MIPKKTWTFLPPAAAALCFAGLLAAHSFDPSRYTADVKFLASPALKGRGTGTSGLEKAAEYIVRQFRAAGLKPIDGKSYLQRFNVTVNAKLGSGNKLEWGDAGKSVALKAREEFQPFNFSSSGKVESGVVFAGYGITAPEYHYDDYAGIDVKGKLVLILRHEPQEFDEKSVFSGKVYTQHAQFDSKAINAKMHGAVGVLFVNDGPTHPGDEDTLEKFTRNAAPANRGIPFVQVKSGVAEQWLAAAGKNMKDIVTGIDKDLKPQSFVLPQSVHVWLAVDVQRESKKVSNVAGYIPGDTDEYVIVGAHYDHLGLGEQFSMAPSMAGTPHPGADDNASGTAGVLELARYFGSKPKPHRGIVFLTFAAEELGLLGSSYYVNNPELPLDKAVAMINMDMIGRIRDGKVFVGGSGTGSTFKQLLEDVQKHHGDLKLDLTEQGGYGSSDHASFTPKQVPVLFFFSGLHADYHRPSDTWDKIDAKDAAELLDLVAELTNRLTTADRPQYVRIAPPRPAGGMAGGGGGYGAWFGSMPDFSEVPNGFRFADIMPNSPAFKAGLKGGDILFEFDGKPIQNLYDFTYALRAKKPGDKVKVKVRRGSDVVEADVTLEVRR